MIKNLSHISLFTNSLLKIKKFYIKKLKLKIIHEFKNNNNETYGYFLSAGKNTFLEFFLTKKRINFLNKKNQFRHICFEVSDIKKFEKKFVNKNKKKITRGKTDGILQFFTNDLEGNIIEFHQRDRKSKF
jgi:catechol 2,3-dioxygenase-like lactoylglutathione lyase family enzyme